MLRREFIRSMFAGLPAPDTDVHIEHYSSVVSRVQAAVGPDVTVRPLNETVRILPVDDFHSLFRECPVSDLPYHPETWDCVAYSMAAMLWFAAQGVTQVGFVHDFEEFDTERRRATHAYNVVVFPDSVGWLEPQYGLFEIGNSGPKEGLIYV
jgi:hypothetical protein